MPVAVDDRRFDRGQIGDEGVVLGIAESLVSTFFGPSWAPAVAFGILLLALAFRPQGLFGR